MECRVFNGQTVKDSEVQARIWPRDLIGTEYHNDVDNDQNDDNDDDDNEDDDDDDDDDDDRNLFIFITNKLSHHPHD